MSVYPIKEFVYVKDDKMQSSYATLMNTSKLRKLYTRIYLEPFDKKMMDTDANKPDGCSTVVGFNPKKKFIVIWSSDCPKWTEMLKDDKRLALVMNVAFL